MRVTLLSALAVTVDLLVNATVVHHAGACDKDDGDEQVADEAHREAKLHVLGQVLLVEDEFGVVVVVLQVQFKRGHPAV
jgi:hypothetical protein